MPWDTRRDKWRRRETTQNHLPQHLTCVSPKRPAASRATFYSTSKQWRKCLRFRSKRAHSTCKTCDVLKSKMHHARDFWRHARACDEHLHHLSDTWKSRQCYWGGRERERERAYTTRDTLSIISDGFDRSKPVLPRWAHGRQPKGGIFEKVNRPHLNITCAYAHSYACIVYLAPEFAPTGGAYQWELLLRTIQICTDLCKERGQQLPSALWLQADNTVKEIKNSLSGCMLSAMVCTGKFCEGGHHHHSVGHTHEDVGALAKNLPITF